MCVLGFVVDSIPSYPKGCLPLRVLACNRFSPLVLQQVGNTVQATRACIYRGVDMLGIGRVVGLDRDALFGRYVYEYSCYVEHSSKVKNSQNIKQEQDKKVGVVCFIHT